MRSGSDFANGPGVRAPIQQLIPKVDFATLDLLPYGIIVLDREGVILYYNRREEEIASRSRLDVLGKNFFTEVAPCTQLTDFQSGFRDAIEVDGQTSELNFHFPFPDRPRDVEVALTSFRYQGELLCLVSVRDLSAEKDVRDRIQTAERFSEIGEVAAGVAHNFNNVLMAIGMWTQILSRQHEPDSPGGKAVSHILKAVHDATRTINRISAGVRESGKLTEQIDLSDVSRRGVEVARERIDSTNRQLHINLDLAPNLPTFAGNAAELQEVVVNLVANAIDASRNDGTITIRTFAVGGLVSVEVTDTGAGMSEETRRKLFRPLFTTKGSSGTGLGLSTSYAIARRHGGEIQVRSTPGAGSTFTVIVPHAAPTTS